MQVYSYVVTIVKNQSLAEEITQNTFYKAMTAKRPYEGKAGELTWLCSIAKNLAVYEYRKNGKFIELDETLPQQIPDLSDRAADTDSALRINGNVLFITLVSGCVIGVVLIGIGALLMRKNNKTIIR